MVRKVTAYFAFSAAHRAAVREELQAAAGPEGKVGVAAVAQALGRKWQALDDSEKDRRGKTASSPAVNRQHGMLDAMHVHLLRYLCLSMIGTNSWQQSSRRRQQKPKRQQRQQQPNAARGLMHPTCTVTAAPSQTGWQRMPLMLHTLTGRQTQAGQQLCLFQLSRCAFECSAIRARQQCHSSGP